MKRSRYGQVASEEGSSLMSTLLLLLFLSIIITSVTGVVKHQILQYKQTAYSYEARALIEMTEVLLLQTENPDRRYPQTVEFSTGKVTVTRKEASNYLLEAVLHNQYTSTKQVNWLGNLTLDIEDDTADENESARSNLPPDYSGASLYDY